MSLGKINIDLNCDLGEIDNSLQLEKKIMPLIDRCNIAIGGHAGDNHTIKETMLIAKSFDVKVGLHPSFPDKKNFGRIRMDISLKILFDSIKKQILSSLEIADLNNINTEHIKAHGALYHLIANDYYVAERYINLLAEICPRLMILIPPYSKTADLFPIDKIIIEAFADRKYSSSGQLQSRNLDGSVFTDNTTVIKQVRNIVYKQEVETDGKILALKADTICVHSDTENSIEILNAIRQIFP